VTSGTIALPIASGSQTANNVLREVYGFRDADRAAAASHTGDFPVSGLLAVAAFSGGAIGGRFVAGLDASPGAFVVSAYMITSYPSVSNTSFDAPIDSDVLFWRESAADSYLVIEDPHRADNRRTSATYFYSGPIFDSDDREIAHDSSNFSIDSLSFGLAPRSTIKDTLDGHPSINAMRSRETIDLAFTGSAMAASGGITLIGLLEALGEQAKLFICLDETEPARMSRLCVVESKTVETLAGGSPHGRVGVSLKLRCLDVQGRRAR
jgi:hypothetical protein